MVSPYHVSVLATTPGLHEILERTVNTDFTLLIDVHTCRYLHNNIEYYFVFRMSEIEQFKKVLDHPSYKANPMGTIAEHIRNVIQLQQEGGT